MKKKVYHLANCTTCQRIIKELDLDNSFELQDIKTQPLTESEIDELYSYFGSYESFFSKRAMKYKSLNVKEKVKEDKDYKEFLLLDYTFLKRPVFIVGDKMFAGNSKKVVEEINQHINQVM